MKKFLVLLLALSVQTCTISYAGHVDRQLKELKKNKKYNSIEKLTRDHSKDTELPNIAKINPEIKNPEVIKLKEYKKLNDKKFNEKLAKDEVLYKTTIIPILSKRGNTINQDPEPVDFYKVYRIAERLIRANKLDYANWRIAIRKTPEDVNAKAGSTNLITIHTALYDTFYNNEDALAFVIAHEMAHHILGHTERSLDLYRKLNALYNTSRGSNNGNIGTTVALGVMAVEKTKITKEIRMMEYMADAEAINLLVRAGYSLEKSMKVFDSLATISIDKTFINDTHPKISDRIESFEENILYVNPNWIDEGKLNLYNSTIIPCKKSSDRVSIVLEKSKRKTDFYKVEELEDKLVRLAIISYKTGKMEDAAKYFNKLTEIYDNYAYYLYESYANEYLYKTTNSKRYLKKAKNAITLAQAIAPDNEHVKAQAEALKAEEKL